MTFVQQNTGIAQKQFYCSSTLEFGLITTFGDSKVDLHNKCDSGVKNKVALSENSEHYTFQNDSKKSLSPFTAPTLIRGRNRLMRHNFSSKQRKLI